MPRNLMVPGAIVLGGVFIALAIFFREPQTPQNRPQTSSAINSIQNEPGPINVEFMRPVNVDEHILGNPNATVKIIEYSDTECPYCKDLHFTLKKLMRDKGPSGEVAWVYRHFPVTELHKRAFQESIAIECAGRVGGNSMFWSYLDRIMTITESNDSLDPEMLNRIAMELKIDAEEFSSCRNNPDISDYVNADIRDGLAAGVNGTPFVVILGPTGIEAKIPGSQDIDTYGSAIESVQPLK